MRTLWLTLIVAALFLPFGWLFLGIYQDREFSESHLFIKHRPSPRFFFRSPVGESDLELGMLTPRDRDAERHFLEFVEEGGGWRRSVYLPF